METNMNMKIIWAVAVLGIIFGGVYYLSLQGRGGTPQGQEGVQKNPLVLQGTVMGVDASKMQIVVATTVASEGKSLGVSTTTAERIIAISPTTKIEGLISQKNAKGVTEQSLVEVNIGDVPKGDRITVIYQSEKDGVLSGVSQISFALEGNINTYLKSQAANQAPYVKGQVVAVDMAGKSLTYKPYFFSTVGTTTKNATFPDDIRVYRIDDPARISIVSARVAATLADIQTGQTIFILAEPQALKVGKVTPQAFIVSGK